MRTLPRHVACRADLDHYFSDQPLHAEACAFLDRLRLEAPGRIGFHDVMNAVDVDFHGSLWIVAVLTGRTPVLSPMIELRIDDTIIDMPASAFEDGRRDGYVVHPVTAETIHDFGSKAYPLFDVLPLDEMVSYTLPRSAVGP